MATVIPVLNEHIRQVARKEMRTAGGKARQATALCRREIEQLKRLVKSLNTRISSLEKNGGAHRTPASQDGLEHTRFRADGLRSHRARLGISARDYGRLLGVTGLTIYNWESGKSRPRRKQLGGLVGLRGLGKREVLKRLEQMGG